MENCVMKINGMEVNLGDVSQVELRGFIVVVNGEKTLNLDLSPTNIDMSEIKVISLIKGMSSKVFMDAESLKQAKDVIEKLKGQV
jgi:hypothetical protein